MTLHLVACVRSKSAAPAPARELYRSDWFRRARGYVEALQSPWFILSAEHGLVHPDTVLTPYDRSLHGMTRCERHAWGQRVIAQLEALPRAPAVVFLAGRLYREPLTEWARSRAIVPMAGMGIGAQKKWLVSQTISNCKQ